MTVHEKFASRNINDNEANPTAETIWQVIGTLTITNEVDAYAALMAHPLPTTYTFPSGRVASLVAVNIVDVANDIWEFKVRYSTFEPKEVDDVEFTFDLSLQDVTVTHAIATSSFTGGGRTAPDFEQGVNISADGKVQGVAAGLPRLSFSATKYWDATDISIAYLLTLETLGGAYNNTTFLSVFPAGTVKFMGFTGGRKGKKFPITYKFEFSKNETGVTVGDITGISRLGWQYLDVYRRTIADTSAKKKTEVPHSVFVHTLPPGPGNFSLLGLV